MSKEINIRRNNTAVIVSDVTLPKYYRISFDLWLDEQTVIRTWRKILHVTSASSSNCAWPELYIHEHSKSVLNHAFKCIIGDDNRQYIFQNDIDISIRNWHQIEYSQLPISNSTLSELTISINGTALHRIINPEAKKYENMEVYYGNKPNEISKETTMAEGKVRNFKIEEHFPGYFEFIDNI